MMDQHLALAGGPEAITEFSGRICLSDAGDTDIVIFELQDVELFTISSHGDMLEISDKGKCTECFLISL